MIRLSTHQNSLLRPMLAALLSLVFGGLGHLYLKAYLRGIGFLLPNSFVYVISDYWPNGVLLNMVGFIIAAFDAFSIGRNDRGIF